MCVPIENAARDKARMREWQKAWYAANPEPRRVKDRAYKYANRDKLAERQRARRAKPNVRAYYTSIQNKRKASQLKRTPAWASNEEIVKFYERAAELTKSSGESWHVDHVIPLQGKLVSGLHVPENLQVIPARENVRKRNKYEVAA